MANKRRVISEIFGYRGKQRPRIRILRESIKTWRASCRSLSQVVFRCEALDGVEIVGNVELRRTTSLPAVAEKIDGQFDGIINNAGVLFNEELDSLDFASVAIQMEINAFGAAVVVHSRISSLMAEKSQW